MRTASNVLLSLAGFITICLALLVALMAAGNEAAIWIGGWGLLFLGIPILVILLTCLFVGLALRAKTQPPQAEIPAARVVEAADAPAGGLSLEWAAITVGGLLLAYSIVEMTLVYTSGLAKGAETGGATRPHTGLFLLLVLFDLKLPVALGLLAFGLVRLRTRKQAEPA